MVRDSSESAAFGARTNSGAGAMFNVAYGGVQPEFPMIGNKGLSSGSISFNSSDIYGQNELNPSRLPKGLQSALKSGESVSFSTPGDNAKSHKQPDFIMNADGKILPNPKSPHPGENGGINIELNSGKNSPAEAAKINAQLQKQAAEEMIRYYQYFNPGKPVPPEYMDLLKQANASMPSDAGSQNGAQPTDNSNQQAADGSVNQQPADNSGNQQAPAQPSDSSPGSTAGGGGDGGGSDGGGGGGGGYSGGGGGYSGGDAGPAGSGPSSSAALSGTGDGMLTQSQVIFADELAKQTGLDTRVVAAWMLNEESGSAAQDREAQHNNDWLNIGYTDTANLGTTNSVWNDPLKAADSTAAWMKGQWDDPGFGTASQGIQDILKSVGQSPDSQISSIQNSGWASGGETALPELFQEVASKFPDGNINTGNATELAGLSVHEAGTGVAAQKIEAAGMNVGGAEGTVGNCLKGVEDSLDAIGINLPRLPEAKDMIPVLQQDSRFQQVAANEAKPGDIAVYGDSQAVAASGGAGHITILEPHGQEASDHLQSNVQGFGTPTVFRYVGDRTAVAQNDSSSDTSHHTQPAHGEQTTKVAQNNSSSDQKKQS